MTHETFAEIQKRMGYSIAETKEKLEAQCGIVKGHYKMACNEYGTHSEQAGKWDRMACALQTAYEALNEV